MRPTLFAEGLTAAMKSLSHNHTQPTLRTHLETLSSRFTPGWVSHILRQIKKTLVGSKLLGIPTTPLYEWWKYLCYPSEPLTGSGDSRPHFSQPSRVHRSLIATRKSRGVSAENTPCASIFSKYGRFVAMRSSMLGLDSPIFSPGSRLMCHSTPPELMRIRMLPQKLAQNWYSGVSSSGGVWGFVCWVAEGTGRSWLFAEQLGTVAIAPMRARPHATALRLKRNMEVSRSLLKLHHAWCIL